MGPYAEWEKEQNAKGGVDVLFRVIMWCLLGLLLFLFLLSSTGCVTPGQLTELKIAQERLRAGVITPEKFDETVDRVAKEAADNAAAALEAATVTGSALLDAGGLSGLAMAGLHFYRNHTRRKRLEEHLPPQ